MEGKAGSLATQAVIAIISNPVNSTVPITAEVLKAAACTTSGRCWA